jgi:peptidoglycan/LPS O-acetylase OafA/YrhL
LERAPTDDRLPVLDGIRGLAIFMIMQYHFWGLGFGFVLVEPRRRIDRLVFGVREIGWTSVDLFFVLSGFLITGILIDAKARSAHYFRNFYARRFLRIFPLYYLFLAVVLTLGAFAGTRAPFAEFQELRAQQVWYWTYLVNVAASVAPLDAHIPIVYSHFWTLAVEEQFYLIWPFAVLALDRRALQVLCVAMIVGALCLRIAIVQGCSPATYENAAHVLARTHGRPGARRLRRAAARSRRLSRPARPADAVGHRGVHHCSPGSRSGEVCGSSIPCRLPSGSRSSAPVVAVLVRTITGPSSALVSRVLGSRFLTMFGRYSYCMYIVHILVGFTTTVLCIRLGLIRPVLGSQIPADLALCALATIECLLIAVISWHLFEKQFLRLKTFFPYERGVVTSTPAYADSTDVAGAADRRPARSR